MKKNRYDITLYTRIDNKTNEMFEEIRKKYGFSRGKLFRMCVECAVQDYFFRGKRKTRKETAGDRK